MNRAPSRLFGRRASKASPCALECKLLQIVDLDDLDGQPAHRHVVIGQVIGMHIDERFIKDGRLDTAAMRPIARCGYADYAVVDKVIPVRAAAQARRRASDRQGRRRRVTGSPARTVETERPY